ncbi:hypothetical protein MNBD_GAMMA08-3081 [hydrothermal vent metagenome]|uniref:Uncharacterized protein n=1 Tax=hydrothermal vent metagenome TaxID=652676 RepID=A0A3B0XGW9_9ZZZZ
MDWLKIGSAVFLLAMIVYMWPRMKHAVANAPKGTMNDWMGYIIPMAAVVGFIILLIKMV